MGTRGNIFGFIWLAVMGYFAYKTLRQQFHCHWFYVYGVGVGLAYLTHICMDELLNMAYLVSGSPFVFGYPRDLPFFVWSIYLRARFKNYLTLILILPALFYKKVHLRLSVTHYTLVLMVLICFKFFYQASNRLVDYAGLTGSARVEMFWKIYPLSYILYGLLFISLLKRNRT